MSLNKLSPQEFIQQTFPPMIAVSSSQNVELSCKKNNLSFVELIRPFAKATVDGEYSKYYTKLKKINQSRLTKFLTYKFSYYLNLVSHPLYAVLNILNYSLNINKCWQGSLL